MLPATIHYRCAACNVTLSLDYAFLRNATLGMTALLRSG
jgi:hypothetical protein